MAWADVCSEVVVASRMGPCSKGHCGFLGMLACRHMARHLAWLLCQSPVASASLAPQFAEGAEKRQRLGVFMIRFVVMAAAVAVLRPPTPARCLREPTMPRVFPLGQPLIGVGH